MCHWGPPGVRDTNTPELDLCEAHGSRERGSLLRRAARAHPELCHIWAEFGQRPARCCHPVTIATRYAPRDRGASVHGSRTGPIDSPPQAGGCRATAGNKSLRRHPSGLTAPRHSHGQRCGPGQGHRAADGRARAHAVLMVQLPEKPSRGQRRRSRSWMAGTHLNRSCEPAAPSGQRHRWLAKTGGRAAKLAPY